MSALRSMGVPLGQGADWIRCRHCADLNLIFSTW